MVTSACGTDGSVCADFILIDRENVKAAHISPQFVPVYHSCFVHTAIFFDSVQVYLAHSFL